MWHFAMWGHCDACWYSMVCNGAGHPWEPLHRISTFIYGDTCQHFSLPLSTTSSVHWILDTYHTHNSPCKTPSVNCLKQTLCQSCLLAKWMKLWMKRTKKQVFIKKEGQRGALKLKREQQKYDSIILKNTQVQSFLRGMYRKWLLRLLLQNLTDGWYDVTVCWNHWYQHITYLR